MRLQFAGVQRDKRIFWSGAAAVVSVALVTGLILTMRTAEAAGATLVVDDDGQATAYNCNSSAATPYSTIGAAVTAATAGDTVKVCPGEYAENVVLDKALTLKGARAGVGVGSRTFGSGSESTVSGLVTIQAADVRVDGFSLTNPGQSPGVIVKTTGNNAVIKKNILQTVGGNTFVGSTVGVYLEHGPDGVQVSSNKISDVQSLTGSAQGILVGDSISNDPSLDTDIDNNTITNMTSVQRGAYGVQVNNGSGAGTGYAEVNIRNNTIRELSGTWAHAIGLEGETPYADIEYNRISGLTDTNPVPLANAAGVFFEDNPFFFTAEVNHNNLDVTATGAGIAVAPTLTAQYPSLTVDGECNWWGASNGPGAVASGNGSLVSAGVDFKPWHKSSNISRDCHKDYHGKYHGNWGHWREDD